MELIGELGAIPRKWKENAFVMQKTLHGTPYAKRLSGKYFTVL